MSLESWLGQPRLAAGAWFQHGLIAGDPDGLCIAACPAGRHRAGSFCVVSWSGTGALLMWPTSCYLPGQGAKGRIMNHHSPVPCSLPHPRQDTQPSSQLRGHGGSPVRMEAKGTPRHQPPVCPPPAQMPLH